MITFGPLTSRRLGYSLGVNHIFPKYCSYDCVYCQVGATNPLTIKRQNFYDSQSIKHEIEQKIIELNQQEKTVDAITFVPDGEPCLDRMLGNHLRALKPLGIKLAVITNGSLLWMPEVRESLMAADWVSMKVDSVDEDVWRKINRPYGRLKMEQVLEGITAFAKEFQGDLVTETMLVQGVNDGNQQLKTTAKFIRDLNIRCAYVGIPSRPPMESWVHPPEAVQITAGYQIYKKEISKVEFLGLVEPKPFVGVSGIRAALISTAEVHPLDQKTVQSMLDEADADWMAVEALIREGSLSKVEFEGQVFYITSR
jgi:wyosine [tRNA(Phe)-imidazoG37] synthetase (radical SAM superfamily)